MRNLTRCEDRPPHTQTRRRESRRSGSQTEGPVVGRVRKLDARRFQRVEHVRAAEAGALEVAVAGSGDPVCCQLGQRPRRGRPGVAGDDDFLIGGIVMEVAGIDMRPPAGVLMAAEMRLCAERRRLLGAGPVIAQEPVAGTALLVGGGRRWPQLPGRPMSRQDGRTPPADWHPRPASWRRPEGSTPSGHCASWRSDRAATVAGRIAAVLAQGMDAQPGPARPFARDRTAGRTPGTREGMGGCRYRLNWTRRKGPGCLEGTGSHERVAECLQHRGGNILRWRQQLARYGARQPDGARATADRFGSAQAAFRRRSGGGGRPRTRPDSTIARRPS